MKGVIFIPVSKTITADDIANILIEKIFVRYGLPDKIISDRDPRFLANSIRTFVKQLGIK